MPSKRSTSLCSPPLLNHSLCTALGGILTLISSTVRFLLKKTHWVGLIVDLKMSAMYVVDSNSACPSTVDVTSYLTPISTMLPHLISRYCLVPHPGEMNFRPFPISRIEVPVLLEHPGKKYLLPLSFMHQFFHI